MHRAFRRHQRTLLAALLAVGGVTFLSVCADMNAPERESRGHVAFAPTLTSASVVALDASSTIIDNVRIIIRTLDGTIVLDKVVPFPAGSDEVSITADLPVHGESERFRATIQLRSGEDALFEGTQDLDVRPGPAGTPSTIPVEYVGTGSNAATVTLAPGALELQPAGSGQLVATVRDAAGVVIQNVPLGWTSSNTAVATVTNAGVVTANTVRGTTVITATTLGGVAGSMSAKVVLPPSQLRVAGGGGQSARVGTALPVPFAVELVAADGVGIPNETVTFTASAGGSISPATATTDANGRASATLTLGTTVGLFTYTASAAGFTASITANATPGDANRIAIAGGNGQAGFTGATLPSPLSVRVTDEFGNPGVGRQVNWAVVTGSLGSVTTTTDASGFASNSYTLPGTPGAHAVTATLPGGAGVTFSATALVRPTFVISIVSGTPQFGPAGGSTHPLIVRVMDGPNPAVNAAVVWTVTGTATVGAPSSRTDANGFASVSATFGTTPGQSIVTAEIPGGGSVGFALHAAGAPAIIEIVAGNGQTSSPGVPVPVAPSVRVTDAQHIPVSGVTVTFGGATGGGSVTGGIQVTNAAGIATVGSWVLGFAPAQTLTATAGSLKVVFTATAIAAPTVASIGAASGDGQIVTQFQPLQPIVVHAMNFSEASVPGATIQLTVIQGGATPTTQTAVTDANGHATFPGLTTGAAGPNVLRACVLPGCTITTDITFTTIVTGSIWRGTISSDWNTAGNWSPAVIPGAASNVYIPGDAPNFLTLTAGQSVNELFMASGSLMSVGAFELTIASKVTATGAFVIGTGSFRLTAAAAPITGQLPSLIVDGTLTASGNTSVFGNVTIESGGRLVIGAGAMNVSGGFNIDPGGRLTMNNAAGSLTIGGSALFSGADMGDVDMTAGLLDINGNLTVPVGTQAFRAVGTHTTRLSGFAAQTLNFFSSGVAGSRFQNLEITNGSASGIGISSNVYVAGTLLQGGRLTVTASRVFTIAGVLTLQSGSNTIVNGGGSLIHGGCVNQGAASATGFTC